MIVSEGFGELDFPGGNESAVAGEGCKHTGLQSCESGEGCKHWVTEL